MQERAIKCWAFQLVCCWVYQFNFTGFGFLYWDSCISKDRDLQRTATASVKHGIMLANGKRVEKLIRTLGLLSTVKCWNGEGFTVFLWVSCLCRDDDFCCCVGLEQMVSWFYSGLDLFCEVFAGRLLMMQWAANAWSTLVLVHLHLSRKKCSSFMGNCSCIK